MGKVWVQNTTSRSKPINGALVLPGDGVFVDDGARIPALVYVIAVQEPGAGLQLDVNGNRFGLLTVLQAAQSAALVSGARILDAASRLITALDNGASLAPTGALTYTIPAGLVPMPSFTVDCPAAGTISIACSGAATINGVVTTINRSRASNPVGFVVQAHLEPDSYGIS